MQGPVVILARVAGLMAALLLMPPSSGADASELAEADCAKCHFDQAADLSLAGASHEKVSCTGCHPGHPPKSRVNIPACGECHREKTHYDKPTCGGCHANPHMPLQVVMPSDDNHPCQECHASQVALIDRGISLHSEMYCSGCHAAHRQTPSCRDCHDPHNPGELSSTCDGCHNPHLPWPVVYGSDMPNTECSPCHREAFEQLAANTTGHGRRACVSCHQTRHGAMTKCVTCHGLPHRLSGKALFADCGRCHTTAHDLNVWPAGNP